MVGPQVFISYRRTDTAGWAGRLVADLRHRLGAGARIFMDVDAIPAGENFASYIDRSVAGSDALIALIGPSWLDARDENGRRRIDAPADFVRLEIEAALRRGIRVIPALVDGAHIPTAAELPHSLGHLVDLQAVRFDNENWEIGIGRIVAPFVREAPAPEPRLEVTTGRIDFGYLVTQQPWPRRTVQLRNAGAGELNPSCTTQDGWLVLRQRDDALDVLVDTSHPGEYEGRILVRSAGGSAEIVVTAFVGMAREAAPGGAFGQPPVAGPAPSAHGRPQAPFSPPQPVFGGRQVPFGQPQAPGQWGPGFGPTMIRSYMPWAIAVTLLCFLPTGIAAIVYASRVSTYSAAGRWDSALEASRKAKLWTIISAVVGLSFAVIIFFAALSQPSTTY